MATSPKRSGTLAIPLHHAARLGAWTSTRPGASILLAAALGIATAGFVVHGVSEACFEATRQWDSKAQRWQPGVAPLFFGLFRISAELCRDATKTPPWILISGMIAAPSVLLTWYWRDKKRRDDLRVALESHQLALESGIAARYKEAAQLLASEDPMTRINGLFSLWDIARESPSHRITVSRTLASLIRLRGEHPDPGAADGGSQTVTTPAPDLQEAALLVAAPEWADPRWRNNGRRIRVDLRSVTLAAFDLRSTSLEGADLREASLEGANLNGANLTYARMTRVNFRNAKLRGAKLDGAQLRGADLRDADLSDASFTGALYNSDTRFPHDFGDPAARGMKRGREASVSQSGLVAVLRGG